MQHEHNFIDYVGKQVIKKSGKPFSSGFKIATVFEITKNPHTGKAGFFLDDGSIVNCEIVKLV